MNDMTDARPAVARVERLEVADDADLRMVCDRAALLLTRWRDEADAGALEELVHLLTPMLWHTVRAYRLDQNAAEDVVQSTWLALVRSGGGIDDPQAVVRWLTVTARREAWRVTRKDRLTESEDDVVLDARASTEPGPEEAVVRSHRDEALWRAVGQLPERCQRLLRVVAFADRPDYEQLSADLGMAVGSIGPTRGRCLAKLRAALGAAAGWVTA